MGAPTNAHIMRELGALTEAMKHSGESRRVLHEKLDETSRVQGKANETLVALHASIEATTLVATQARDQAGAALQNIHRFETEFRTVQLPIIAAAQTFKVEAEPVLATMRAVQWIVLSLLGMGIFSIGSIVALFFYARDWLAGIVRILLGL